MRLVFSVRTLAHRWGCSHDYVYDRLAAEELVGAFKLGRYWRIPLRAVLLYESAHGIGDPEYRDL